MRAVRLHLKDVVLKNVNLNYVGKEFRKNTLTKTRFKFFHSGSNVIVAGKYDPVRLGPSQWARANYWSRSKLA